MTHSLLRLTTILFDSLYNFLPYTAKINLVCDCSNMIVLWFTLLMFKHFNALSIVEYRHFSGLGQQQKLGA